MGLRELVLFNCVLTLHLLSLRRPHAPGCRAAAANTPPAAPPQRCAGERDFRGVAGNEPHAHTLTLRAFGRVNQLAPGELGAGRQHAVKCRTLQ